MQIVSLPRAKRIRSTMERVLMRLPLEEQSLQDDLAREMEAA